VTVMSKNHKAVPFAAVFVLRPSQPTVLHAHLPLLIATSTLATPNVPAPRVVQLPSGCGARLCESLGLARVSFIGLREGAPNSTQVVDLIRRVVPEVRIPWVEETKNATYLPVKINMIKTKIGKHKGNAPNPNNKASGKTKTDVVNT
jgi:ribonuclease P/MRP protein subunit POP3